MEFCVLKFNFVCCQIGILFKIEICVLHVALNKRHVEQLVKNKMWIATDNLVKRFSVEK